MEETQLFEHWNVWAKYITYAACAAAVLTLVGYLIKLASTTDFKNKYDFINKSEINTLWIASIALIVAGGFYANSFLSNDTITIILIVRLFTTISMGLIVGVVIRNLLKFYYPFYIEKRLKKLRYKPRISPKTGKAMKLLSEEEEDVYLDEGMQAEENIFSVDYDVWVDEETGYTKIEKYSGHLHALQCPECNYQTFRVEKEEIVSAPNTNEEGELIKFFACGYCGHKSKKSFKIAMLQEGDGKEDTATV